MLDQPEQQAFNLGFPPQNNEGQRKIAYDRIDPRSLSTEQLKLLRILPAAKDRKKRKRVLEPTGDGDFKPVGYAVKKEDSQPDIKGKVNIEGGYFIIEIKVPKGTRERIGPYIAAETIFLEGGVKTTINPQDVFYTDRSGIVAPRKLIDQILKERLKVNSPV